MPRHRVLLVDDDASIRRFVALALDELDDVELVSCATVREAVQAFEAGPVALLITDLMMPVESGLDLLARLQAEPALRGRARMAVFSAGLNPEMRARLASLDVWRQLAKPVSAAELEACVRESLPGPASDPVAPAPSPRPVASADRAAADAHFGGDLAMFHTFRDGCRAQFVDDVRRGDDAIARLDLPDLRHLAHSLKSVLLLLGEDTLSATARQLEDASAHADAARASALWPRLREGVSALADTSSNNAD